MTEGRVRDMTVGNPMKLVLSFMLPMILGLLFQQLYSMVDTVVVGKFLGTDALAGVGSTNSINFLVLGLCNGMCAGFAIPVAQKFGQKDMQGLRRFVGSTIWLAAGIALVVTLFTTTLCGRILRWMNTPEETFQYAYNYIFLIFLGIPATMLYNLLSGILRALGDSKTPLAFLILSSILNVALDIGFIVGMGMGVAGASLATLLSQLVSGLLCLYHIGRKYPMLHLRRDDLCLRWEYARRLLTMGLPMGMQYSITAIGSILLQTAVNGLGASAMAAITTGSRVSMLCVCPFDAMGATMATFSGQNMGAGKLDRVHQGLKDCAALGIVYSALIFAVMYWGGSGILSLFVDARDAHAISQIVPLARQFLLSNMALYIPLLFVNLLRFTIQGLGFSQLAVFAGVFEMIARGLFGLCLVPWLGFGAVCFANPAAWILADLFLIPAYLYCLKKRSWIEQRRVSNLPAKANI